MITCTSKDEGARKSLLSNGRVTIDCDNPEKAGGDGYVFGPHDFIEAGVAACMNAGARRLCEERGVSYEKVVTSVSLNHDDPETSLFNVSIRIIGAPEEAAREIAELQFKTCRVKATLSKNLVFKLEE